MKDLKNNIFATPALNVQVINTDTTTNGAIVDTAGYESVTLVTFSGTLTDGAYQFVLADGDNSALSDAATVTAANLIGSSPAFALADDNECARFGYRGGKRYVRVSCVSTSTSSGGTLGVVAILGHAHDMPTS